MAFRLCLRNRVPRLQNRHYSVPRFINNLGPATVSTTQNGVRVVTEPAAGPTGAVAVQLWIRAGSIYEQINGQASLLQRLAVQSKSSEVQKYGGKLAGGTCREYTVFTVQFLPNNVAEAVQTLGDIASGFPLQENLLHTERQSMISNVQSLVDTWNDATLTDHLFAAAYQGTPYASVPSGEVKSLKTIDQHNLSAFRSSQYTGRNMVLSVVGPQPPNVSSAFSRVPIGLVPAAPSRVDFTGSQINIRDDTVHNAQVLMAYETVPYNHKHWGTFQVLQALIGSWKKGDGRGNYASTRLAETMATEKLVDNFHAFNYQTAQTGIFGVYINTHNVDVLDDAVYEVFNEYQKLYQFLYAGDLARAQSQVSAQFLAAIQDPVGQARGMGKQVSQIGRRISPAEVVTRVNAVTVDDVREVVDTYFNDTDPVVVAHGPLAEMLDYGILRQWTYWNRR